MNYLNLCFVADWILKSSKYTRLRLYGLTSFVMIFFHLWWQSSDDVSFYDYDSEKNYLDPAINLKLHYHPIVRTNNLLADFSVFAQNIQVQSCQHKCVVPVQRVRVVRWIFFTLPTTKITKKFIYVLGPVEGRRVGVQDFQSLHYERHWTSERRVMVQKLYLRARKSRENV